MADLVIPAGLDAKIEPVIVIAWPALSAYLKDQLGLEPGPVKLLADDEADSVFDFRDLTEMDFEDARDNKGRMLEYLDYGNISAFFIDTMLILGIGEDLLPPARYMIIAD